MATLVTADVAAVRPTFVINDVIALVTKYALISFAGPVPVSLFADHLAAALVLHGVPSLLDAALVAMHGFGPNEGRGSDAAAVLARLGVVYRQSAGWEQYLGVPLGLDKAILGGKNSELTG